MYSILDDHLDGTSPEDIPIAGAFDFEAAFPRVMIILTFHKKTHAWIIKKIIWLSTIPQCMINTPMSLLARHAMYGKPSGPGDELCPRAIALREGQ